MSACPTARCKDIELLDVMWIHEGVPRVSGEGIAAPGAGTCKYEAVWSASLRSAVDSTGYAGCSFQGHVNEKML